MVLSRSIAEMEKYSGCRLAEILLGAAFSSAEENDLLREGLTTGAWHNESIN